MEEYKIGFDKDSKIAWNRHYLREQFDKYKLTENSNFLFFAYIALLGFGFYDIISFLHQLDKGPMNLLAAFAVTTLIVLIILSIYYFWSVLSLKLFFHDNKPFQVYCKGLEHYQREDTTRKEEENIELVKDEYLVGLEYFIAENQKLYNKKRVHLHKFIKTVFFVLLIYVPLLIISTMADEKKPKGGIGDNRSFESPSRLEKNLLNFDEFVSKDSPSEKDKLRAIIQDELNKILKDEDNKPDEMIRLREIIREEIKKSAE
jgi:hypothetical protein